MTVRILVGKVEEKAPLLEAESFDAVFCDPPYGLSFMGKAWDHGVPGPETWAAIGRTMKPGAHLLAFGGTRTFHRLTCAIEDAGLEIRDCLVWLYLSGFPKSLDIGRQVDGVDGVAMTREACLRFTAWMRSTGITAKQIATATDSFMASHYLSAKERPAIPTPEHMDAMRPYLPADIPPWVEELVEARRVGSENVKQRPVVGERLAADFLTSRPVSVAAQGLETVGRRLIQDTEAFTMDAKAWTGYGTALKPAWEPVILAMKSTDGTFAANALRHGVSGLNIDGSRIAVEGGSPAAATRAARADMPRNREDAPIQNRTSLERYREVRPGEDLGRWPANVLLEEGSSAALDAQSGTLQSGNRAAGEYGMMGFNGNGTKPMPAIQGDSGGASRMFYCAKPDSAERNAGLGDLPLQECRTGLAGAMPTDDAGAARDRFRKAARNIHPTVKPIDLCAYLAKLLLPPPRQDGKSRRILVPFSGSGSEIIGALRAGWEDVVAIEMDPAYVEIARRRIRHDCGLFQPVVVE